MSPRAGGQDSKVIMKAILSKSQIHGLQEERSKFLSKTPTKSVQQLTSCIQTQTQTQSPVKSQNQTPTKIQKPTPLPSISKTPVNSQSIYSLQCKDSPNEKQPFSPRALKRPPIFLHQPEKRIKKENITPIVQTKIKGECIQNELIQKKPIQVTPIQLKQRPQQSPLRKVESPIRKKVEPIQKKLEKQEINKFVPIQSLSAQSLLS